LTAGVVVRFLKLTVAYDGTAYAGWQQQRRRRSVQQQLQEAWERITGEPARMAASSRTDAGVHALGQVVSCESRTALAPHVLQRALNARLPEDIRVHEVAEAPTGFHATRAAVGKRYRYLIQDGGTPDLFLRDYCWYLPRELDVAAMQQAARTLVGQHDFASFQNAGSPRTSTVRNLRELTVARRRDERADRVVIEAEGDGFLYNMVRNLVGTLVEVGQGRRDARWPAQVLAARRRSLAGRTAPPHGLFLVSVACDR